MSVCWNGTSTIELAPIVLGGAHTHTHTDTQTDTQTDRHTHTHMPETKWKGGPDDTRSADACDDRPERGIHI